MGRRAASAKHPADKTIALAVAVSLALFAWGLGENSVESLHMQIRKTIKTRGHFPNDDAALRLIWLAIMRAKTTWRTCYNWTQAMAVLRIHFGDRIPDNT